MEIVIPSKLGTGGLIAKLFQLGQVRKKSGQVGCENAVTN